MSSLHTGHPFLKAISCVVAVLIIFSFIASCNKYPDLVEKARKYRHPLTKTDLTHEIPVLDSINVTAVSRTNSLITASIISSKGSAVLESGICYAVHPAVSVNDQLALSPNPGASISVGLSGLKENQVYYVRAYAKNFSGIGYSREISFTTLSETDDPYNLSGTWKGFYGEVSVICGLYWRVSMNVTMQGDRFTGIIAPIDDMRMRIRNLTGILSTDGNTLVVDPEGNTIYENPWTISGTTMNGSIQPFIPAPPDTIVVNYTYRFTKE